MLPTGALVKHVQIDEDYNRFYAEAEVTLTAYVEYAEIHLRDVDPSVHAGPLTDAKVGTNTFHISGIGASPFKVGDKMRVYVLARAKRIKTRSFKVGSERRVR
jgi:hypothetical protein